jgi:drug/metabolite transporter (DMT)-like permease
MKLRAYVLMLFVTAVWGSTFVLVKNALNDSTPATFNCIRMFLAFVVLAVAYHRYWREIRGWQMIAGAIVGLCMAAGYQFQTIGLVYTTPSKSAFITGLVVVIVPFLSVIPGLRPPGASTPRWNAFLGAGFAFVGIILLTAPPATHNGGSGSGWNLALSLLPDLSTINLGDVLTFGGAIAFAFHCLALSHFSPRIAFHSLALLQVGFCALMMLISLPFIERPHVTFTPRLLLALAIVAVLATAAAFSIQSWAQAILPSTHMALLLTLEPVFAWITSFLVTGEKLGLRPTLGALLILAGIAATELVPQPRLSTAHEV